MVKTKLSPTPLHANWSSFPKLHINQKCVIETLKNLPHSQWHTFSLYKYLLLTEYQLYVRHCDKHFVYSFFKTRNNWAREVLIVSPIYRWATRLKKLIFLTASKWHGRYSNLDLPESALSIFSCPSFPNKSSLLHYFHLNGHAWQMSKQILYHSTSKFTPLHTVPLEIK